MLTKKKLVHVPGHARHLFIVIAKLKPLTHLIGMPLALIVVMHDAVAMQCFCQHKLAKLSLPPPL